ncbi:glycoside hydrolase family 2 TIM barrel-domain containing protein [Microbacterium sp. NPDC089698]|uniref:glycoside hydrolase family 2 TIM barrel-domain containing protein n=1 Tax=Microbacterium sp. NPDC089698 TaxID=3364200 RepID=UPI0038016287
MTIINFNHDWAVAPQVSLFAKLGGATESQIVALPHDALITMPRATENRGKGAFFPSAAFQYSKTFDVPDLWHSKHVILHFDGVYRDAMVYLNGTLVTHRANGYMPFDAVLDPYLRYGEPNIVRVEMRTHDDSRWYAGAGIYRDVRLEVRDLVHIRANDLQVTTPAIDDELAVVEFAFPVANLTRQTRTVEACVRLTAQNGLTIADAAEPVTVLPQATAFVRIRAYVDDPHRWSVDDPYLYGATVELLDDGTAFDSTELHVGIRTLDLDPRRGLRINGAPVKLRGACIHHDNGLLGTAAFADAEFRKIRLLKEAGFNAIRSSHNPVSEAMLDACDALGMIVMDESFDVWTVQKSSFDYSIAFPEWWERDLEAMVRRDRTHPSVMFYSIGNEIPETGDGFGAELGRRMYEKVKSLDPDRFVTNGINGFVSVIDDVVRMMQSGTFGNETGEQGTGFGGVNDAMSAEDTMDGMNQLSRSPLVTARTAESFGILDVAGMNYGDARYDLDAQERPRRIIVGSETYPARIAHNWPLVQRHANVIGDFTWTGWDYIGEVGIGRPRYQGESLELEAPFPWLLAWCGDFDITGFRRPASYFREIVFGLRAAPYIAVRSPESIGLSQITGGWAWSDSQGSWDWGVETGSPIVTEVYSADDEVELLLNGQTLGRRPAGPNHRFTALFNVAYEPGELVAVGWSGGTETGRTTLRSRFGNTRLRLSPEVRSLRLNSGSLVYLPIELVDEAETLIASDERSVTVMVEGAGVLQALGSARPDNPEPFGESTHRAFRGRLLAIIRPTREGTIRVSASAGDLALAKVEIEVVP